MTDKQAFIADQNDLDALRKELKALMAKWREEQCADYDECANDVEAALAPSPAFIDPTPVPMATAPSVPYLWRIEKCKKHDDYNSECSMCEEEVLTIKTESAWLAGYKAALAANSPAPLVGQKEPSQPTQASPVSHPSEVDSNIAIALQHLVNEVSGTLGMRDVELALREAAGNTNVTCILNRLTEAKAALRSPSTSPGPSFGPTYANTPATARERLAALVKQAFTPFRNESINVITMAGMADPNRTKSMTDFMLSEVKTRLDFLEDNVVDTLRHALVVDELRKDGSEKGAKGAAVDPL